MNSVKKILQSSGFSVKNPKEIRKIINTVQNKLKGGEFGKEKEELKLTLKTYIEPKQLCENLRNYNPKLLKYYKTHNVSFSDGGEVVFEGATNKKIISKLTERIYKTRNALFHNKSNESRAEEKEWGIYHPFSNEQELSFEIPLMRLIAEDIIIKSAEEI